MSELVPIQILKSIEKYLPENDIKISNTILDILKNALGGTFECKTILVAYGGGKDSSFMLTYIRYLQLKALTLQKSTFNIRVIINRHSHMSNTVIKNIHNVLSILGLYEDKKVEVLLVDDEDITVLNADLKIINCLIPKEIVNRDRIDMLMAGHLTQGEGRRIYCDACNAYMQKGEALAITKDNSVDIIITGDSLKELVYYKNWINKLYKFTTSKNDKIKHQNFIDYMYKTNIIAQEYFKYIHCQKCKYKMQSLNKYKVKLFSLYKYISYNMSVHRKIIDKFLKFKFDINDFAFCFTESDCSMPVLMAYLRGLKAEKLYSRTYFKGVQEYVEQLALPLMRQKKIPNDLIKKQQNFYSSFKNVNKFRIKITDYYEKILDLNENNFIAMIYSPFTSNCKNLELYINREILDLKDDIEKIKLIISQPDLKITEIDSKNIKILEKVTGLTLQEMQYLYTKPLFCYETNIINKLHQNDPYKAIINTKHSPMGSIIKEEISGR